MGLTAAGGAERCRFEFRADLLATFVDPATGDPVPDGELGELVITTLTKEGQPVLRYRTRDLTRFVEGPGADGRTFRRIDRLQGRVDDMLIIRGVNVFPSQFEELVMREGRVAPHFQLELRTEGRMGALTLVVEPADGAAVGGETVSRIAADLGGAVRGTIGVGVEVRIVEAGSIERSQGKATRVKDLRATSSTD